MPQIKRVKFKDIQQGAIGSCALLAIAPDNLLFQKKPEGKIAFQFYDRLTGAGEWVTIKAPDWRLTPRSSSDAIERGYGKWLKREGIYDEQGKTGVAAVANGNAVADVALDVTGKVTAMKDLTEPTLSLGFKVVSPSVDSRFFILNHAYRVVGVSNDNISLFNPWARDGREIIGANDGILTMTNTQFAIDFVGWGYSF